MQKHKLCKDYFYQAGTKSWKFTVPIFSDNALANIQSPFKEYKQYLP